MSTPPSRPSLQTTHLTPPNTGRATPSEEEHTPTNEVAFRPRRLSNLSNLFHLHASSSPDEEARDGGNNLVQSWWDDREHARPWHNPPRRKGTIPPEQEIAYERTKAAVKRATAAALQTSAQVAEEVLIVAADALELAPVAGLDIAAKVLLSIWEAAEATETNRLSCLRLTERCANILYSVRLEVDMAGPGVQETLREPVQKLTDAFRSIEAFIHKQVSRPFLKRYLKRDEDARKIISCDAALTDAVSLFGVAIQVRMLKGIQDLGVGQQERELDMALIKAGMSPGVKAIMEAVERMRVHGSPPAGGAHALLPPGVDQQDVIAAITAIRAAQAARDSMADAADLYAAMRAALRSGDDVAMLETLQIDRNEIQEAIKTLQRALEDPRLASSPTPLTNRQKPLPDLPLPGLPPPSITRSATVSSTSGTVESATLYQPSTTAAPADTPSTSSSSKSQYWSIPPTPAAAAAAAAAGFVAHDAWDPDQDAAFHREFIEGGLDALRRLSKPEGEKERPPEGLPPWTITKWEVDREGKIGIGFFSDVYKGSWRGVDVAIKILAETTPRKLFRHEMAIWASLKHPNVLELLGASSATGDPPWFFVSPYMKNGSLVGFLKARAAERGRGKILKPAPGPLQMMHEIAVGMAYLHRKDVLHGDLKAVNVLIDDDLHCVISDFGQSQLRSEVYRLSQKPIPHGTLRWQAPEILSGESTLTPQADVYAFAIVCVEILTNGELPWPLLDDQAVQTIVLRHNKRPKIPLRPETSLALVTLIEQCWSTSPLSRPLFEEVARGLGHLIGGLSAQRIRQGASPSPRGRVQDLIKEKEHQRSPDMAPVDLPDVPPEALGQDAWENLSQENLPRSPTSTLGLSTSPISPFSGGTQSLRRPPLPSSSIPLQRVITPNEDSRPHSRAQSEGPEQEDTSESPASLRGSTHGTSSDADKYSIWGGPSSPLPREPEVAARRDERRYRLLLQHDFHPSLNLPLWDPSPVKIGAVGYLSRPSGSFVSLFNALAPSATSSEKRIQKMASIHGYGSVRQARQDSKRGLADIISGFLTFRKTGVPDGTFSRSVRKRYTYPLRAGHKHAYICTENTTYRYMENIDAAKAWFKANIKDVLKTYGAEHDLHREDVFLVIGTLETRDYGLFVSHEHPDGQVHFNIYADRQVNQDWGIFSTDFDSAPAGGPDYHDVDAPSVHATKISKVKATQGEADAVLLARLRFKPDEDEPTRL